MKTKFIIGTSGWNYSDWRGDFYPANLPRSQWLAFYSQHFKIVEVNATFYRIFPDNVFLKWREQAAEDFHYIIKINRIITHFKKLVNCKRLINKFIHAAELLGDKLGLMLLQLPPNLPYDPPRLKKFLSYFPDPTKIVVEFRDKSWFTAEIKQLLEETGCVYCAADSPKTQLVDWVTSETAYIRLHGRTKWFDYEYTADELDAIASFAKSLAKKGAKKVYIFFNNTYYDYAIKNAYYLREKLKDYSRL